MPFEDTSSMTTATSKASLPLSAMSLHQNSAEALPTMISELLLNLTVEYPDSMAHDTDAIFFKNPEEMLVPWNMNAYFFPIIITYIITFIIGVSGNLIVIVVMAGDRASRSVTSVFLVSLAVADLLLLTIYLPLEVAHYFVVQWDKDGTVCKLAAYAESVSAFASVLNLVAVTFERFVVIVFPIRSRSLCTMSNCKRLMIVVWLLSLSLAIPVIFTKTVALASEAHNSLLIADNGYFPFVNIFPHSYYFNSYAQNTVKTTFTNYEISVTMFSCKEARDWTGLFVTLYKLGLLFAVPSLLMIGCYTWVIIELWISTKTMDELTQSSIASEQRSHIVVPPRPESRASISHETAHSPAHHRVILRSHGQNDNRDVKRARQQVIKMLILVVILFLVCWGPRLLMETNIMFGLSAFNHATYTMRIISHSLPFVHSCLNPIVYCFMSSKFRHRMLRCFERTCAPCSSMAAKKSLKTNQNLKASVSRTNVASHLTTCSVYTLTSCSPSGENLLIVRPVVEATSVGF